MLQPPSYPFLTMQMLGVLLRPCHSRQLPCTSPQTPSWSMNRACMCTANNRCRMFVLTWPVLLSYQVRLENLSGVAALSSFSQRSDQAGLQSWHVCNLLMRMREGNILYPALGQGPRHMGHSCIPSCPESKSFRCTLCLQVAHLFNYSHVRISL